MAKLHRAIKLQDRGETNVYTFLIPSSAVLQRNSLQDSFTREFDHGHHKWTFSAQRSSSHFGLFVSLKNPGSNLCVEVDLGFTLINQDHYARNEKAKMQKAKFDCNSSTQGVKNFCTLDDLTKGNFVVEQGVGWFVVEVEMKGQLTVFQQTIKLTAENTVSSGSGSSFISGSNNISSSNNSFKQLQQQQQQPIQLYESSYFCFGNFDWSLLLYPFGFDNCDSGSGGIIGGSGSSGSSDFAVSLSRLSSFDSVCKVKYEVSVKLSSSSSSSSSSSYSPSIYQSDGTIETMVNANGRSRIPHTLQKMGGSSSSGSSGSSGWSKTQEMQVRAILKSCSVVGEATLKPFIQGKNRTRLYDREEQAWTLETDVSIDKLLLRLFYDDVSHVPRFHMRKVTWCVSVLPVENEDAGSGGSVGGSGCGGVLSESRSCYYIQTDADDGQTIQTTLSTVQLQNNTNYLDDGGNLHLQLEWLDSHLLFMDRWIMSDDVILKQRHQMRQELMSLETENLALEKQVQHYQISQKEEESSSTSSTNQSKKTTSGKFNLRF